MQLHSASTFQSRPSSKGTIPYSSAALRQDLERVRGVWDDCEASRDRNAIYAYLTGVYGLGGGGPCSRPSAPGAAPTKVGGL